MKTFKQYLTEVHTKIYPTQDILKNMFTYKEGNLHYNNKVKNTNLNAGDLAGGKPKKTSYGVISIKGQEYKSHLLVWIYHNGKIKSNMQIDHIDRNTRNNDIGNLRQVSVSDNMKNRRSWKCNVKSTNML